MRRIVGSCLGARWRLPVMPVQPFADSLSVLGVCVFYPRRVYNALILIYSQIRVGPRFIKGVCDLDSSFLSIHPLSLY